MEKSALIRIPPIHHCLLGSRVRPQRASWSQYRRSPSSLLTVMSIHRRVLFPLGRCASSRPERGALCRIRAERPCAGSNGSPRDPFPQRLPSPNWQADIEKNTELQAELLACLEHPRVSASPADDIYIGLTLYC